ncbi:helix-turn-helix domain-containing protein, partial [Patescibacteria group bacterium]|nr:helix-turn-helix domain-containing protein [Patescibacteria group bacterium]
MQKLLRKYRRMTDAEREEISRDLAQGENISDIARRLGRSASAISREKSRNSG